MKNHDKTRLVGSALLVGTIYYVSRTASRAENEYRSSSVLGSGFDFIQYVFLSFFFPSRDIDFIYWSLVFIVILVEVSLDFF